MALTRTIEDTIEQGIAGLITAAGISGLSVVTSDDGEEPVVPFALVSCQSVVPANSPYGVVHTASVRVSVYEASKQRSSFLGISWGSWKATRQTLFKAVRDLLLGSGFKASLATALPDIGIYEVLFSGAATEPEGRKINNYTDLTIHFS